MTVEQTRRVIDHMRIFHSRISQHYHRLADSTQRSRVKMLLDYMADHEERLADCLTAYEDSAPAKILNTWLSPPDSTDAMKRLADAELVPEMSVDEVVDMGVALSQCALDVYESLATQSEPESVQQVFANLLNLEQKALQQFVRDAGRLADL